MSPSPYVYNAVVHRVIDGDTIVLNVDLGFGLWRMAQTFRLLGVNAQEKSLPGGSEAGTHLDQLLPHGSAVMLQSVQADKFGNRYDAAVTLPDGRDLATLLIKAQWASAWDGHGVRPTPAWPRTPAIPTNA